MSTSLPKLSYVLLSHNREKYIRAAIESAFAQDYEGELEYIFSDDCSTDRTFEIIQECVAEYKGNRRVVITQTPHNVHLAGNTNHAVQFVESDWVIRADDDDISHVSRCSAIGNAIMKNPGCRYVFAQLSSFTDSGEADVIREKNCRISDFSNITVYKQGDDAATSAARFARKDCLHQAWHASVYRTFGALHEQGYYVDDVMCHYRAMMLGYGVHLNYTLAYIRTASNNMSRGGDLGDRGFSGIMKLEKFHDKYYNTVLPPLEATLQQISQYASECCNQVNYTPILNQLENFIGVHRSMANFWRKGMLYRLKVTRKISGIKPFSLLRCLPMPLFAAILATIRRIKNILK